MTALVAHRCPICQKDLPGVTSRRCHLHPHQHTPPRRQTDRGNHHQQGSIVTTTHVHNVTATARVSHYPDLARPAVAIAAYDAEGSDVAMFFNPGGDMSELDRAEAWLRDALDRVQVAKIAHANNQQEPLPLVQVGAEGDAFLPAARIGEPIDITGQVTA